MRNYLQRGGPSTRPAAGQLTDTIHLIASPGEYAPATLSIRAIRPLRNVEITLKSHLRSDAGHVIPKSAVEIRLVDPFESWTKTQFEQFLLRTNTTDIPADTTRRFWLTVHVSADAKPGTYRSKILVRAPATKIAPGPPRRAVLKELTYELQVLPIKLATAHQTGMAFFMFNNTLYYPPGLLTEKYQQRVFQDMRAHGMTTATVYSYCRSGQHPGEPPVGFVDDEFRMTCRTKTHLGFARTMALLEKTKLVAPGVPVLWLGPEGYSPEVWKALLDEGRKKGWPEILFYAVDEPEEERNPRVRAFMRQFNAFRRKHPEYGARVTTALGSSHGIQAVGHYYDLWIGCMAMRIGESGMIEDARMQKKELWTYDCMLAPIDAETERYRFGVWAWVSGVRGCAHWSYFDGRPTLSYVYPARDEIIPTVGWEAVREGIDDYRYLWTLKRLTGKARAAGRADLVAAAGKVFRQVRQMVTMDNYGKAYHKGLTRGPSGGAYLRPRVEPKLKVESYGRMRLKAAGAIAELQHELGASQR